MNYPPPNGQYYYGSYPHHIWSGGYNYAGTTATSAQSAENFISSGWHAGFPPILVILAVTTGILAWKQYGAQLAGSKKAHSDILDVAMRAGGILVVLSVAVNVLGQSTAITRLELTYQHMLMVLLTCVLLWNYVASVLASSSSGTNGPSGDAASKSADSKSSSSRSGFKSSSSSSSSRPSGSAREASSRSSSSAKPAEGTPSSKSASSSSSASAVKSSTSRPSSSSAETSRSSASNRAGESNDKDPDPWEKSHPSAYLSTTGKDRPQVWPFPIGYDKARPVGEKKLWWESGLPHVVGSIQAYPNHAGSTSAGIAPEAKGDSKSGSREQTSVPLTSSRSSKTGATGISLVAEAQTDTKAPRPKPDADKRQREKLKAAYLEMKKDPNTDPAKLAKLKKLLSSTMVSNKVAPEADADISIKSSNRTREDAGGSVQDKNDLLMAQYMHMKGDPNSDPAELKRLKSEIASLRGPADPISLPDSLQSSDSTSVQDQNKTKRSDASSRPPETSARSSGENENGQRRQLKELYQKLKADPNTDPRKLEKVKTAILKMGEAGGKATSAGAKHAPGQSPSQSRPEPDNANAASDDEMLRENRIGEDRRKNLRHVQMAVCVAAVAILNLQVGFLCGVGFAIYLLEDMINPTQVPMKPPTPTGVEEADKPKSTSRGSDGKSQSSSASSSSKRTLTETEKASLPTSTGKSKDKDKTERLPPISIMYMATPSPKTPHVWAGPDFPLAIQGTSSALVSSVYTP